MSETGMGRVCEQCGRAFTAGKSWSKFCSSGCKVRAFRARNRSESDLERLLSAALDAVRRGNADGPALTALRRALLAALPPEEQPAPVAEQPAAEPSKVKPSKVKPSKVKPSTPVEQPAPAEQPAPSTKQPALFGEELAAVADKAGDLSSQVAARLRRARESKVKFSELAREVDLADHSQLSRLASGKGNIGAKRLAALDAALSRRGF
jgi:hypothetical protein